MFADFLVTYTPYVKQVVFQYDIFVLPGPPFPDRFFTSPKLIPWFVSDVTPPDFKETLSSLLDPAFFPSGASPEQRRHLEAMVTRWQKYSEDGVFKLSVPIDTPLGGGSESQGRLAEFWTTPWPYWDLRERDAQLWEALRGTGLVILKVSPAC